MTWHFDYCLSASEGDNQSVRSPAPVVSRCFPSGYNVKLYISRGRLAWRLPSFFVLWYWYLISKNKTFYCCPTVTLKSLVSHDSLDSMYIVVTTQSIIYQFTNSVNQNTFHDIYMCMWFCAYAWDKQNSTPSIWKTQYQTTLVFVHFVMWTS